MDGSAEGAELPVIDDGASQTPARRSVRRRLVQSTLVPHRSQDDEEEEGEGGEGEEEEDSEEECRGSQGKKKQSKRGRKGKTVPQTRASKKFPANGKGPQSKKIDNSNSPAAARSDFFLKVSERRLQKGQQKEQQCVGSGEGNDLICSPPVDSAADTRSPQQSKKRQLKTTPAKKGASSRHISTSLLQIEHTSQMIPDLRLEAKRTAEENSRIFAGRQMHPFFSSWNAGKRYQETTEQEANSCSVERMDKSIPFGPIHVFDKVQDDALPLDWRNWIFRDGNFFNSNFGLEDTFLSEDCIESLTVDKLLNASEFSVKPSQNEAFSLDQCSISRKDLPNFFPSVSSVLANGQMACCQLQKGSEMGLAIDSAGFSSLHAGPLNGFDVKQQIISPQERMMSYCLGRSNHPENSLWTNKYLPEKAMEVCGNGDSIKFLSEWLRLWHNKGSQTSKNPATSDKCIMQDIYYDCNGMESDSEYFSEDGRLQNVLLVTGPVGSGKSAAIYACAKEQGFQVLELSASDCRNGALVKLKIGEALESHSLKWSLEKSTGPQRKQFMNLLSDPALFSNRASKVPESEVIDLIHLSDEEDSEDALRTSEENRIDWDRDDKTLLLFEDVDITSTEDRGFVAAIQQLAETAKQPIILTSNSRSPVLPDNLHRLQLPFSIPSPQELLFHVIMVCAAEEANIEPYLLERFIRCCQGDIRKTIMNIQFWCQHMKGKEVQKTYSPLLFDLDAGHQIIPKIIPWSFPSQLSELVEKDISDSLSTHEKGCRVMEVLEEEDLVNEGMQQALEMRNNEKDIIEAKKDAMLNWNYPVNDANGHTTLFDAACEIPNSPGFPVAFTRRNVRRKLGTVLSSDSEDEIFNDGLPVVGADQSVSTNNELHFDLNCHPSFDCLETQNSPCPSTSQAFYADGGIMGEMFYQGEATAYDLNIDYTCKSVDTSCVPESSFVPETEINDGKDLMPGMLCCGNSADILEADSVRHDLSNVETNNLDKSVPLLQENLELFGIAHDTNMDSVNAEVVGDSQKEHMDAITRGYHMLDECSRIDFNCVSKSIENPRPWVVSDSVKEAWRKLRGSETDLRRYVTPVEKDSYQAVNLAYKMSSLISEADLLQSDCQQLLCDVLEPPASPSEESHIFCWREEQLHMTSAIAQHGFCLYAKNIAALQLNLDIKQGVDLIWEMLANTSNTMALGKLIGYPMTASRVSGAGNNAKVGQPTDSTALYCETPSSLQNIIQSIVPSRTYFALKGDAVHEYLSSLGQISKSETARLSDSINKTRRGRRWGAQHYLSDGAMMLSPTDIVLLDQYNCQWKNSSLSVNSDRTLKSDN